MMREELGREEKEVYGNGEGGKNREEVSCEAEARENKECDKIKVRV